MKEGELRVEVMVPAGDAQELVMPALEKLLDGQLCKEAKPPENASEGKPGFRTELFNIRFVCKSLAHDHRINVTTL